MSLFWCSCISQATQPLNTMLHMPSSATRSGSLSALRGLNLEVVNREVNKKVEAQWSFVRGSTVILYRKSARFIHHQRTSSSVSSYCDASSEIATCAFTWGTVAVLPFYTLMVVAPNTQLTKRVMKSSKPYVLLGILYAYLVYLSWTPDTLHTLFASKQWLPELPGITKLFSSEMTMASAWIHYMVVDLFAARQIFHNGLRNKVGTWHSICLCLLCCPVGIISHAITKALIRKLK